MHIFYQIVCWGASLLCCATWASVYPLGVGSGTGVGFGTGVGTGAGVGVGFGAAVFVEGIGIVETIVEVSS
jgi:hypothetical protein